MVDDTTGENGPTNGDLHVRITEGDADQATWHRKRLTPSEAAAHGRATTVIRLEDLTYRVPDDQHDGDCDGWINVAHPVRPEVIMQRLPCAICNADVSKPDPWPEAEWTISYG